VDTGSREENASKQQALAVLHEGWKGRLGLRVRKCRLDQAAITVLEFPSIKGQLSQNWTPTTNSWGGAVR
jgi:hypothetical protein